MQFWSETPIRNQINGSYENNSKIIHTAGKKKIFESLPNFFLIRAGKIHYAVSFIICVINSLVEKATALVDRLARIRSGLWLSRQCLQNSGLLLTPHEYYL
jgi:hypothetical protein